MDRPNQCQRPALPIHGVFLRAAFLLASLECDAAPKAGRELWHVNQVVQAPDDPTASSVPGLPIDHVHTRLKYQALHAAAEFGYLDCARFLVAIGAKVRATT